MGKILTKLTYLIFQKFDRNPRQDLYKIKQKIDLKNGRIATWGGRWLTERYVGGGRGGAN